MEVRILSEPIAEVATREEFFLRPPLGGVPMHPDHERIQKCPEHFQPLIEKVRSCCSAETITLVFAGPFTGKLVLEGTATQLSRMRNLLTERNLLEPEPPATPPAEALTA